VLSEVRREFDRRGKGALATLRRASRHADPQIRGRARLLLLSRDRDRVLRRLAGYAGRPEIRLENGLWILSRLEQPNLDMRPYLLALDAMAAEVIRRIENKPPGLERALVLPQYLGQELGYSGDEDDYHHPDNIYLHRAIERRRGMPLTLAAVYQCVARRAGLSVSPVPIPGHVMLRLREGGKSALIDVFKGGERRTERDLLKYLAEQHLPFNPSWFRDADDASMFQRQINNLRGSYRRRELGHLVQGLELVLERLQARASGPAPRPSRSKGPGDDAQGKTFE
jgi:regulator of sirC expression with transglutaminase-like and TPR domain